MSDKKVKGHRMTQTIFYMKRGDVAYFRNDYGKYVLHKCDPEYISRFVYGDKYDFELQGLISLRKRATLDLRTGKTTHIDDVEYARLTSN